MVFHFVAEHRRERKGEVKRKLKEEKEGARQMPGGHILQSYNF